MKFLKRIDFSIILPAFAEAKIYQKATHRHNRTVRWFKYLYPEPQFMISAPAVSDYLIIYYKELDYSI